MPHTHLVQSADPNLRLLNSFLDYLKVEKGLAPLSVAAYHSDLEQYSEFLLKRKRALRDARRQDVRDFLNALLSNGVDGRSVARKLSALRHFYKYLLLDRYITVDPTLNLDYAASSGRCCRNRWRQTRWRACCKGRRGRRTTACRRRWPFATARCWKCFMPGRCACPRLSR